MAKHAHSFTEAYEMETVENTVENNKLIAESIGHEISNKPNTGSFLKPDQKEHADKVFEFLTKKTVAKDCECDKLQADKEEMFQMLKNIREDYYNGSINKFLINNIDEIESLIQKYKQ